MGLLERFGIHRGVPKPHYIAQGEYGLWRVTDTNRLVLFGHDYGNPTVEWRKEPFDRLILGFMDRMDAINADRTDGKLMELLSLQVESHVALGFWLNGDLTLDHLRTSNEIPSRLGPSIDVPAFLHEGRVPMQIRNSTYHDSWQFRVDGHPDGWEIVRHIPDALAEVAGERTI